MRFDKSRLSFLLSGHGFSHPVTAAAKTRFPDDISTSSALKTGSSYEDSLNRFLDIVVEWSGSRTIFAIINSLLLVWVFMAIPSHASENWQAVISDVQALIDYVFDSLLMRQQGNDYMGSIVRCAQLESRAASVLRMSKTLAKAGILRPSNNIVLHHQDDVELPVEDWYDRCVNVVAKCVGSVYTLAIYWLGIIIWLGFGPYCGWSNQWQLYINSATSAMMIFTFVFLANLRNRHRTYTVACFEKVAVIDGELEAKLRYLTGDEIHNYPVTIDPPERRLLVKAIDVYATVVGSLFGIAVLIIFFLIWIGLGSPMKWSPNWLLISGTYCGLLGLFDGFVLRNTYFRMEQHENANFEDINKTDEQIFALFSVGLDDSEKVVSYSLGNRIAIRIGRILSSEYTVLSGFLMVLALISISSAMKWSLTGQLISNVPPSLIETFFTMILITAHNIADAKSRSDMLTLLLRRKCLLYLVGNLVNDRMDSTRAVVSEVKLNLDDDDIGKNEVQYLGMDGRIELSEKSDLA